MRAITIEAGETRRLVLSEAVEPQATPDMLTVAVRAVSLNHGEVRTALEEGETGQRPGWDFAGVVAAAPVTSGFAVGDRVAGLGLGGSWAERIAVPPFLAGRLPDAVSFEAGACLPTAGLTAALALRKRADLAGLNVLVTGATGGVGSMAVQLAADGGARVTALVRNDMHGDMLARLGASTVALAPALAASDPAFDLIVEAVGGSVLGQALGWLASGGVCVACGDAGGALATFDSLRFRNRPNSFYGGTTLFGFFLGEELTRTPPGPVLEELAARVAAGRLQPLIAVVADWSHAQEVAGDLLERRFVGKAVLTIG